MRVAAGGRRFRAPCSSARSFRGASSRQFRPDIGRKFGNWRVAAELERPDVSDDGPAVRWRNLRGIAEHSAKTVGNHVVEVAVGNLPQARIMITRRMFHP